jgi:cytochrome c551
MSLVTSGSDGIVQRHHLAVLVAFVLFLTSCGSKDPKFQQYYAQGEVLYVKHCSNCHQKDGSGLGLVYPPLNKSDFMAKNFHEVICLMKYGREGELVVNGNSYNQRMPGNALLSDLEIAEIATYIYNTWDNQKNLISVQQTQQIISACKN